MNMIRKANKEDIPGIMALLRQVAMVHHEIRPDLFKSGTTKYDEQQLAALIDTETSPIFVSLDDDGRVLGHAFCVITESRNHRILQDARTLYIDDICVDENVRGQHVGSSLYDHVCSYARSIGCYNITLNVWEGNDAAYSFYKRMGMKIQKTGMETIL